jgi:hypothetical protein
MNTTMLKRARKHFCHAAVPTHTARHNMRAWVRALRFLGDRWLLSKPQERRNV